MFTSKKVWKSSGAMLMFSAVMAVSLPSNAAEVYVMSDRSDFHLQPVFDEFEQKTGIKVNQVHLDQGGIPARMMVNPNEADLIISTDSSVLAMAKEKGWTQPLPDFTALHSVIPELIDKDRSFVGLSYRSRVIIYNPEKIKVEDLHGYADLVDPKYKGRVCIRPLTHTYNVALVSQILVDRGEEFTQNWVTGLKNNLAVEPQGNDRQQAKLVAQGVCDLAVMNTYYYGMMLLNSDEREIASKIRIFFPEQQGKGTYALTGGAALTKSAKNVNEAIQLLSYLLGPVGQGFFTNVTFEYPAVKDFPWSPMVKSFAENQPDIKEGKPKFNFISPELAAQQRQKALDILQGKVSQ